MAINGLALVPRRGGRRFGASRLVRLGDVLPSGDVRLDALARYLQDIAADDGREAAIDTGLAWLVRKTILRLHRRPRLGERLELVTWASGSGARWAERRTTITAAGDVAVEAVSLWVCVDGKTLRPARLPDRFWAIYGDAVDKRTVSSRLTLPDLPAAGHRTRPWPLRVTDLDVMGHVNNAVAWAAVEDELDRLGLAAAVVEADLEYREPIDPSQAMSIVSLAQCGQAQVWLAADATVLAAAAVVLRD